MRFAYPAGPGVRGPPASRSHRAVGDTIVVLLVVVALICVLEERQKQREEEDG